MRKFFWSLFIAVWMATAAVGLVQLSFFVSFPAASLGLRQIPVFVGPAPEAQGMVGLYRLRQGGRSEALSYFRGLEHESGLRYALASDRVLAGSPRPGWEPLRRKALESMGRALDLSLFEPIRGAYALGDPEGAVLLVDGEPPLNLLSAFRALLTLGVSAGICLLVARRYAMPVEGLREAAGRIAAGDLAARVRPSQGRLRELGEAIDDFNLMASRLEQQTRDRDRFLADISHEIRSPVARIKLVAELLRREGADREGLLRRLDQDCERVGWMVAQLSSLSRLDHAEGLQKRRFSFSDAASSLIDQYSHVAGEAGVTVAWRGSEDLAALVEPGSVTAALENLLRNALRFAPRGSRILLAGERSGSLGRFSVIDEGPGVEPQDLPRLAQPFFRSLQPKGGEEDGMGLGLVIASRAAQANGGRLELANRKEGGFCASLLLPLAEG